jgi:hypothetical protein
MKQTRAVKLTRESLKAWFTMAQATLLVATTCKQQWQIVMPVSALGSKK